MSSSRLGRLTGNSEVRRSARTISEDGPIGSVSVLEGSNIRWEIPDFFTLPEKDMLFVSPRISSSGFQGRVVFHIEKEELLVSLSLFSDPSYANRTVTCYIGSERAYFHGGSSSLHFEIPEIDNWVFKSDFHMDRLKRRRSELMSSDTLSINIYFGDDERDSPKKDSRQLMGLQNLSSSFYDLFVSKKKTDATIKLKDKEFPIHKAVLVARSSVFSAMFGHDTREEQTGVVTVPDCDADSFQDFLLYLYTGKFDGVTSSNAHHLYVTSDKYDVQELKSFCVDHMKQNITVESVLDVVAFTERYEESELMSAAQDFFNRNFGKVILTSDWETLLKENSGLTNRLLLQMATLAAD